MNKSKFSPIKLGSRQFRGQSKKLLEFDANVEFDAHSFSDVIFVSVYENFKRSPENSATMQIDVVTLRQVCVGIKTVLYEGKTDLKIKTGGTGKMKILTITVKESATEESGYTDSFFINIKKDGNIYGAPFRKSELKAMLPSLEKYCDLIDEKVMDMYYNKSIKAIKAEAAKRHAQSSSAGAPQ